MYKNFWSKLKKPILVLAPMYNVTDSAFRQVITLCGKPDVLFTEFVSSDGILNTKSRKKLIDLHLKFKKNEHPIVAQIFGSDPNIIKKASKIIARLGFDGIDINMGCPDKKVVKNGQGGALILNSTLAKELIYSAKDGGNGLPVSVKTRIGFNKNIVESWVSELISAKPSAITIHGRTVKEMSKVPADWNSINQVSNMIKKENIVVIGNGDVQSREEAISKAREYNVDGIMIGRGVFKNMFLFNETKSFNDLTVSEKMSLMKMHAEFFNKQFEGIKHFNIFKKNIKNYVSGFNGAKELREKIIISKSYREFKEIIKTLNI